MDHLVKPYVKDNPQLSGILWRVRSNRMPISYSRYDIALSPAKRSPLFRRDLTRRLRHGRRAELEKSRMRIGGTKNASNFNSKLVDLLESYRSTMKLYYYNWDEDKFSLILT